jgi:hypothetical protein
MFSPSCPADIHSPTSCSRRFHLVSQTVRQGESFNQKLKTHSPKRTSDETQHKLLLPDGRGNALLQAPLVEHIFLLLGVPVVLSICFLLLFFSIS